MSSNFLENNPKIRREGVEKKWFREEKIAEEKKGPTSLAQTWPIALALPKPWSGITAHPALEEEDDYDACLRELIH